MKNENFNEQDSLKLINEMISQAKNNIQIGSANGVIRSGYAASTIALLNIMLMHFLPNPVLSFFAWTLMIPVSIIGYYIDKKKDRSGIVKTHIDRIIHKTWIAFSYSVWLLVLTITSVSLIFDTWVFTVLIMPVILTLTGLAQYITGIACKFKPFIYGAFIFGAGAIMCILLIVVAKNYFAVGQFVILIICMISGFCIPGHILNKKATEQHV